jgi:hypothetical protein
MALITDGLTNGGRTTHYQIKYDDSLSAADGRDRANALIAVCESDFDLMTGWFGGISLPYSIPYEVQINPGGGASASWGSGPPISLIPGNGAPLDLVRYLLVAEVTEMFMLQQGFGWSPLASSEGSAGEGLSHFLATQLLMSIGSSLRPSSIAGLWLNSPRQDFINNVDSSDNANDPKTGSAVLFLWYLATQLNLSTDAIVAAGNSELAGVFRNLTADNGDPFPFFKQLLDVVFPSQTTSSIPGPNRDNPYPLGLMSFWVDKSTFGRDEVQDAINLNGGIFPDAFWLVIEGFSMNSFNALGVTIPPPTGSFATLSGLSISRSATPIDFENPANPNAPQRIRIAYDVGFTNASLVAFPTVGAGPVTRELDAVLAIGGNPVRGSNAATLFDLVAGADPYFTNVDPAQNNVFWLSQDLRVFTAVPEQNNVPVSGGPSFGSATVPAAFTYIQNLLAHLNSNYSDPNGTDPFNAVLPSQAGASTGDSSVTPLTFDFSNPFNFRLFSNYNFAVARVRLRGTSGSAPAQNVRVFFRLWSTQTADTDYQVGSTYPSTLDGNGLPGTPQVGVDHHTIPFFATGNLAGNTDYSAGGPNIRTVTINSGDQVWAYYGCFLNLYDSSNIIDGQPVQQWLNGTHHCIVAQIAYDDAPIVNANGLTMTPESSDKLAQRNLQVTLSDNPGPPDTHRIPQTFDIRPSQSLIATPGSLLNYPDELMIDWGKVPVGSRAQIYWPQVDANQVLQLARELYGSHVLSAADPNTIECKTTDGVTYVPIPPAAGPNYAGLLTVDLRQPVTAGQVFDIIVRRVATRRSRQQVGIAVARAAEIAALHVASASPAAESPSAEPSHITRLDPRNFEEAPVLTSHTQELTRAASKDLRNWRYVIGTFQVKIPVTTGEAMLFPEENTLAIMKWRLQQMPPSSRWYLVLRRYISYLSARVDGLGGNSGLIEPSPIGVPPKRSQRCPEQEYTGKICEVSFDCFGDFTGFVLCDCHGTHTFRTRERGIAELALRACRERLLVSVYATVEHGGHICRIVIRC